MKTIVILMTCWMFQIPHSENSTSSVKSSVVTELEKDLSQLVDDWHLAASTADLVFYIQVMHEDFVFLGTAPEERWKKEEFISFCKPYFDAGKAWDFKAKKRYWNFSPNKKTAFFDEILDTWMGECRATGILIKVKKEWKIVHYNLHVLIENEKMNDFLKLRNQTNN
jgi:ketosteroid isomerase-like protein